MKKFLIILTLSSLLPLSIFAQQSVLSSFNGYGDIVNVIDVDPTDSLFTIEINNFYGSPRFQPFGPWIAQDVQVGMVMWVDCARFVITNVNSASFSTMNIDVKVPSVDWNLGVATPLPNSRCAVVFEDQYLLTALPAPADGNSGALSGINNTLFACMLNHYSQALLVTKNSVNEITDYVAGLDTIPSEAPGPNIGETWRNSVGQLFYSNGTQWLTDKEIKFSNASLEGLPSYLYKLGIDTLGQDTLYISNNGIFRRFQSGLVYKEGYGINIFATDSIEVDTNQIATQYDISLLPTGIDTFQLNNDTLKLSLVNDFEPFKKVILPVVGISPGTGISTSSVSGVHTITNTGDLSNTNELQTLSTGTNTLTLSGGGGTVTVDTNPSDDVTGSGADGQIAYFNGTKTITSNAILTYDKIRSVNLSSDRPTINVTATDNANFFGFIYQFGASPLPRFRFGYQENVSQFYLQGTNTAGNFTATPSLLINRGDNNNVGINLPPGSPGPSSQFVVAGNSYIAGANGTAAARLHVVGADALASGWTAQFHNSSTNNALMIRNDGFVGIGTATQSSGIVNFEAATRGRFHGGVEFGSTGVARISNTGDYYKTATGSSGFGFYNNSSLNATVGDYFWAEINSGINPTSGSANFSILKVSPTLNITGTAAPTVIGIDYNPTLTSVLGNHYAAVFRSGRVGIGTAAPAQTLHVAGTMRLTGNAGTATEALGRDASGDISGVPFSTIVTSGGGLTGNGVVNYLSQYNSTSTLDTTGIIWVGGRMGIGATAPAGRLHVVGQGGSTNIATFVSNAGNTIFQVRDDNYVGYRNLNSSFPTWFTSLTSPRVGLQIDQTLNTYGVNVTGVNFYTAMSNTAGISRFYELGGLFNPTSGTATYKGFEITTTINQTGGANGDIIGFDYNPSFTNRNGRNFAALFRSGNVGIGTATPNANLRIQGYGATASTFGLIVTNSDTTTANATLVVRDDKRVGIGTTSLNGLLTIAGAAVTPRLYIEAPANNEDPTILIDAKRPAGNPIFSFTNQGRFIIGNGIGFYATTGGATAPIVRSGSGIFVGDAGAFDNTAANGMVVLGKPNNFSRTTTGVGATASTVELIGTHSPASTNIRYNMLSIIPVYNQTGTANGAFTGIDYNPTITNLVGPHYAATFRTGFVGIGTADPTDQLHTTGSVRLQNYPNTLNSTGNPVNVLSTSSTGVVESHPISEVISSAGGITGSGVNGQVSFWTGAQTQGGNSNFLWDNTSSLLRVNGGIGVNRDPFGGRAIDITGGGIRLTGSTSGSFEVNGSNSSFNVTTTGGQESILLTDNTRARISMTGNSYKYELQVDDVRFRIRDRTAGDLDRLTILANGSVGISAVTPIARLHVAGSSALSADRAVLVTDNATTPLNLFEIRNNGDIYFNDYPNTLNTTGNPVNVLSTGTDGLLQSHPISEVISSAGGVTGSGVAGQVTFWNGTSTVSGSNGLVWYGNASGNFSGLGVGAIQFNGFGTGVGMVGQGFASAGANRTLYMKSGTNNNVNDDAGIIIDAGVIDSRTASASFSGVNIITDLQSNVGGILTTYRLLRLEPLVRHSMTTVVGIDYNPNLGVAPTNHYAATFRSGLVGIGLSAPTAQLQVRSTGTTSSTTALLVQNGAATPANLLSVLDNGDVGIGTNAPGARLQINGSGLTSSTSSLRLVDNNSTQYFNATDDGQLTLGKNVTLSTASAYRVFQGNPILTNTVSGGLSQDVAFFSGGLTYAGSEPFFGARAMQFAASNRNTATSNQIWGAYFVAQNETTTARASQIRGMDIILINNATGGTISEVTGIRVVLPTHAVGSTISNTTGISIADLTPTTAGTQTNVYSISSSDENARMYHAGNVGIGSSVQSPTRTLDINGETRIRDLTTTTATGLVGADADGVLSNVTFASAVSQGGGLTGNGVTNYLAQYNSSNTLDTTGIIWTGGRMGIGTATPSSRLDVQASSDAALVGSTNLASGFASTVVGSWVFDAVNSRWDHITGNTNTLTATVSNISAATQIYRATVTIVNRTAGSIRLSLKGSSWPVALTGTSTIYFEQVNAANNLVVTPTSDFNGSVSIVINSITEMPATTSLKNTSGTVVYEERATVAISNILQGVGAGKFAVSGGSRVYIGQGAGKNSITSGNIAIGTEAGMSNYSGGGWAAIGSQAGTSNISGINWYAIGNGAGQVNVSGNNWFAIGTNAARFNRTGSSFVAIGERAAYVDTTASAFIAIGASAAINHLAGSAFVAIGAEAAAYYTGAGFTSATDFSNGVYIGYQARVGANGAANETVIGYQALGLGTNTTRIGNSNTIQTHLDGRLTIGNTFYDSRVAARIVGADVSTSNYSLVVTDSDGATSTTVDPNFVVRNDGNVGIGTYSPTAKLQINGSGNTSATNALRVENSDGTQLLNLQNQFLSGSGVGLQIGDGTNANTTFIDIVRGAATVRTRYIDVRTSSDILYIAGGSGVGNNNLASNFGSVTLGDASYNLTNPTQFNVAVSVTGTFAPTSGGARFVDLLIKPTINQTGGSNGISRGLYVIPTLTSVADWRSIEWSNNTGYGLYGAGTANNYLGGSLGIGATTPSRTLHVAGEARISDLTTDTPTRIVGADADGDLGEITLGSGLSITSGTISVTNPISASEVFIESSTATTIDLDANTGVVKDVNGTNASFTLPTDLSRLNVYKNGIRLARTGTATTRDFSVNTGTNEITFTTALLSTDRIVIVKI